MSGATSTRAGGRRNLRDSGCFEELRNVAGTNHQSTQRGCKGAEGSESRKKEIMCPFCAIKHSERNKEVRLQATPIEKKCLLNTETSLIEFEQQLLSITEDISQSWRDVGHNLGIPYKRLQSIDTDHPRVKDKATTVLMLWRQQNGKKATVACLAHALIAAGRRDVAEKLAGGNPWLLQLTVEGVLKTEISTKGCCYVCTDACGGQTYLVAEIDKTSVVIDSDTLTAKITGLWDELRGLESPFTIDSQSSIKEQLMSCETINRRLQGLDTQLINLTGDAGQTKNLEKPETIQSIMVLKECTLMLHTQNVDLANRISLLWLQRERMKESERRQLDIVQTSQEGIPKKIKKIDGILDILMQESVGSRNSAPNLSKLEHMWPGEIAKFLSESLSRPDTFDTKL